VSGPHGAGSGREATRARKKRVPGVSPARCLFGLLFGLIALLALPASAAAIDEYVVPGGGNPGGITTGPDGAIWFTQEGSSEIGRLDPRQAVPGTSNGITEFPITTSTDPAKAALPALDQIVSGPDGRLWFTMPRDSAIGAITTSGAVTPYPVAAGQPEGITLGPDGNLWFTDFFNQVGRITTTGNATFYGPTGLGVSDIVTGPDGRLWFTEQGSNRVGAITTNATPAPNSGPFIGYYGTGAGPSGITYVSGSGLWFTEAGASAIGHINLGGALMEFPGTGLEPSAIALGRDNALWFTESDSNTIGRITTGGAITNHFPVPTPASEPSDLTSGPDGALWFSERTGNKIGRIETAPPPPPPPPPPVTEITPRKKPRCKVPKVKGLSVRKAKKKLKKAKCKYRVRGKGFVVSTKPKAGKRTTKRVVVKAKPKKAKRARPSAALSP
jgi:virginiamycin B lyase